jgi:adenylylsulfate kinase
MGLSGAGKTTIANKIAERLDTLGYKTVRINADIVRTEANDWDFSIAGRLRQAKRMQKKSNEANSDNVFVITDFICPTKSTRYFFNADVIIWMDTVASSQYKDTDAIFEPPTDFQYRFVQFGENMWDSEVDLIVKHLISNIEYFI